ncbi:T9SS type A sorting domain-containing protein, partial [uncultured Algibacter sp.]|uniref:T9SS type A sorting domain-containing protein n=1 Tax=uncultured Algibacter sp. TaxID=298659 RepID=UPI00261BD7D1
DNYGGSSVAACERPTDGFLLGELSGSGTDDCDDSLSTGSTINPGATEIPGNGLDDDCNPATDDTLSNDSFNLVDVQIFPNPFDDRISISLPLSIRNEILEVTLYNLLGKQIVSKRLISHTKLIQINNLDQLSQGVYILKVSLLMENNQHFVKRLVKFN